MHKSVKYALRLFAVLAVLALIPVAFSPSQDSGLYVSGLSDIVGSTFAQPICQMTKCNKLDTCVSVSTLTNCILKEGCKTAQCPD